MAPPHHLQQFPGNREAQTRTTVMSRIRFIALNKRLKQTSLGALGNTHSSITHFETHQQMPPGTIFAVARLRSNSQLNPPFRGELDRVADYMIEHLAQASRITLDMLRKSCAVGPDHG